MGLCSHHKDGPVDTITNLLNFVKSLNEGPFYIEVPLRIWAENGIEGIVWIEALMKAGIVIELVVVSSVGWAHFCSELTRAFEVEAPEDEFVLLHVWKSVDGHLVGRIVNELFLICEVMNFSIGGVKHKCKLALQ